MGTTRTFTIQGYAAHNDTEFKTRGLDADQIEAAIKATVKMLNKIES